MHSGLLSQIKETESKSVENWRRRRVFHTKSLTTLNLAINLLKIKISKICVEAICTMGTSIILPKIIQIG